MPTKKSDAEGEPGVKRLRALLDPQTFRLSDSELERRFRPIALVVEPGSPPSASPLAIGVEH